MTPHQTDGVLSDGTKGPGSKGGSQQPKANKSGKQTKRKAKKCKTVGTKSIKTDGHHGLNQHHHWPTKIPAPRRGFETAEKQWQMKRNRGLNTFQNSNSSRLHITKAKVIPSHPNRELTHIESINKKLRDAQQLIFRESKTEMEKKETTTKRAKKAH